MNFAMNSGGRSWHLRAIKIIAKRGKRMVLVGEEILWKNKLAFEERLGWNAFAVCHFGKRFSSYSLFS